MKALIVDDEKHVRQTIRFLVDWGEYGIDTVLEAEDGIEAVALIEQEKPQLIITDMMMPLMNGVQMMEWMEAHAVDSKKIVISGHNDFELVRHTVRHGGTDYLLKPIVEKQLREAVRKAVDAWRAEEEARLRQHAHQAQLQSLRSLYRDQLLTMIMANPGDTERELERLRTDYPEWAEARDDAAVAVLRFDWQRIRRRRSMVEDGEVLTDMLLAVCHAHLADGRDGFAFRNTGRNGEIVMVLWMSGERAEAAIRGIDQSIVNVEGAGFVIGLGEKAAYPEQLGRSYKQAELALKQRNLLDSSARLYPYVPNKNRVRSLPFSEFEPALALGLQSGSEETLVRSIDRWYEEVRKLASVTLEQWELWTDEYQIVKARWIEKFVPRGESVRELSDIKEAIPLPLDAEGLFSAELFRECVEADLLRLMRVVSVHQAQNGKTMSDVAKYIQANYASDITLRGIAAMLHMNREYVSRKFKQEMNENVIDYLNRIRIEKSMVLLSNPHLKITEIANRVGYQDEKYFSRLFKRQVGVSPKEYRSSHTSPRTGRQDKIVHQ